MQRGTVISSPNSSASGGTVILTMADLSLVQVKTWVDETDVGKLRAGQSADVIVAAFPNRPFKGTVLKIEPQADTIQNVTMFPVDIRIDNRDNLLKPGMNADVRIAVGQRSNVLAVPNAALRTEKDVVSAGTVLGINPADLQQMLADAKKTFTDEAAQKSDTGAGAPLPNPNGNAAAPDTTGGNRRPTRRGGQRRRKARPQRWWRRHHQQAGEQRRRCSGNGGAVAVVVVAVEEADAVVVAGAVAVTTASAAATSCSQ